MPKFQTEGQSSPRSPPICPSPASRCLVSGPSFWKLKCVNNSQNVGEKRNTDEWLKLEATFPRRAVLKRKCHKVSFLVFSLQLYSYKPGQVIK